jgi:hypothetical protein
MTRQCWFQPRKFYTAATGSYGQPDYRPGFWTQPPWQSGTFHAWTQDYEEFENGPGMYPAGIIEDIAGRVHCVHAESVNFGAEKPT